MEGIAYAGAKLTNSQRKASFVELLRYGFAWFGLNAIFSRPALLDIIGTPTKAGSEFEQFRVLFQATPLATAQDQTNVLHGILAAPTAPRLANKARGTMVPTLFAIDTKYIPAAAKKHAKAKLVSDAASMGSPETLDLATLLYTFRNWAVHGNALDGAFGSRPRFLTYVGTLLNALAEIHAHTAVTLQSKL